MVLSLKILSKFHESKHEESDRNYIWGYFESIDLGKSFFAPNKIPNIDGKTFTKLLEVS